ncbi:MAG: DNA-protecting protein DprA [Candidatus Magasanikbacteria bacterium]|nr:DNA-protecting protein DprA [Candidatus Magasanikbacteria bacterium]
MNKSIHVALSYFPKITYRRYQQLAARFSLPDEELWQAEFSELARAGLDEAIAQEFMSWRDTFDREKMFQELFRENITTVTITDHTYPHLLKEINDPPQTLFVRGRLEALERPALAIVGTRKCTAYGREATETLARDLAHNGLVIVSGLALGIDGLAHRAALQAGGLTVAVLGSGIDRAAVYPAEHRTLSEDIIAHGGAVISEYPPGFKPTLYSFPARNRIIAGLALGTLVTEAPESSGALITAKAALDYNREVMAVPHPITSETGVGGNALIKQGATVVTSAEDVTEVLQLKNLKTLVAGEAVAPANPTEARLLSLMTREPRHIDLIIKESGLASAAVSSSLTLLEMKGRVKNTGGMLYVRL